MLTTRLAKAFVAFAILTGGICLSKNIIEIHQSDELAELEEAAIQTLTTCYGNRDKTIVLVGDFSGIFIKRLSSHRSFSLVSLNDRRRTEFANVDSSRKKYKVQIVVIMAAHFSRVWSELYALKRSAYYDSMASFLVLGSSRETRKAGCDGTYPIVDILRALDLNHILNANVLCRDRARGTVIYGSNPYKNQAPEPWQLVRSLNFDEFHYFTYFVRDYREHEDTCENLEFDRTRDLGGSTVRTVRMCYMPYCSQEADDRRRKPWRIDIEEKMRLSFIDTFIGHINATRETKWVEVRVNFREPSYPDRITMAPYHLRGLNGEFESYTYPYAIECKHILTQFRGNQSQLNKIFNVIDRYSWIGMYVVYLITLAFFKLFMRQPLAAGILNLVRLTCNTGILTVPASVPPRIYLGCLFFFVVTMQGIFVGNLAAILTYDIPVRQVHSIQDLAEFGYTVYASRADFLFFDDPVFEGRLVELLENDNCARHVRRDPSNACLCWGAVCVVHMAQYELFLGDDCIGTEYICNPVPWKWALGEKLDTFLGHVIAAGVLGPLDTIVSEKMLLEAESQEIIQEPKIMTLTDLSFSFAILGIGLGCAIVTFVMELLIHRINRRVANTRLFDSLKLTRVYRRMW